MSPQSSKVWSIVLVPPKICWVKIELQESKPKPLSLTLQTCQHCSKPSTLILNIIKKQKKTPSPMFFSIFNELVIFMNFEKNQWFKVLVL
jgi:hypothetical protein